MDIGAKSYGRFTEVHFCWKLTCGRSALPADGPPLNGGRSAVISVELEQNRFWLCGWSKMTCGPSATLGRTVRSPTFQPKPEKQPLWMISLKHLRTVRTPEADCPQYGIQAQTELQSLWTKNELYLRTVRLTGPDRPPVTSFSHKLININSNTFSFANVPTPPREQHHMHVY